MGWLRVTKHQSGISAMTQVNLARRATGLAFPAIAGSGGLR
ncbi:MAG: hypothetical protein ACKOPO_04765 [Novosphingobium sp.]